MSAKANLHNKKKILGRKRPAKKEFQLRNEEISSDESETPLRELESDEESDEETPEMKRKRLSKSYLKAIENDRDADETEGIEEEEAKFGHLSNKIRNQRLISQGKLQENLNEALSTIEWDKLNAKRFYGHKNSITSVALSTDDSVIVSGSKDNSIIVW